MRIILIIIYEIISDLVATTILNKSADVSLSGLHSSPHPEVAIVSKNTLTLENDPLALEPGLPLKLLSHILSSDKARLITNL